MTDPFAPSSAERTRIKGPLDAPIEGASNHEELPPRPERPDCCNGGCAVCVLEGYDEEVQRWEEQVAAILKQRETSK